MATLRLCSILGCGKPHKARGWCNAHWLRWRRFGNPVDGGPMRQPFGEPERFYREVVLTYDGDDCLIWPFGRGTGGYGRIYIDGATRYVHRVVCMEVNGPLPTPKHEAAHSCGNGHAGCCAKRHMSWKTPAENNSDKLMHGTTQRGGRNPNAKLSSSDVFEIHSLKGTLPQHAIAERFDIDQTTVGRIHRGDVWGWLVPREHG